MTAHSDLVAGPLAIRDSVKTALFSLRYFEQLSCDNMSPPYQLKPATLDIELIAQVESAFSCDLPFEILACLANGDGELDEYGFDLGRIAENTELARQRGCSQDSIAVGCHPDMHAFYCISTQGKRDRAVQIIDLDNFDGSQRWFDLAEWLSEHVERRHFFCVEDDPQLEGWTPEPNQIAEFQPALVDS